MTAIEWLMSQLPLGFKMTIAEKLEEAREMEKQQIIDAREDGIKDAIWFNSEMELGRNGEPKMSEQYFAETYGSKGSDDQVPDVRKMVEDDNYLTPVDWLMDRIKWIHRETYDYLIKEGQYDVAKRTENAILNKANELQSSQTEISDEEIEKEASHYIGINGSYSFKMAIKWYREQLKKK